MSEERLTVDREIVAELLTDLAGLALALKHIVRGEESTSAKGLRMAAAHLHELHARIVEDIYGIKPPAAKPKHREKARR